MTVLMIDKKMNQAAIIRLYLHFFCLNARKNAFIKKKYKIYSCL